jgi:hypothetical protein
MLQISGAKLQALAHALGQIEAALSSTPSGSSADEKLRDNDRVIQTGRFIKYSRVLKNCGFKFASKSVERTLNGLKDPSFNTGLLTHALRELHTYIIDEIDSACFWRTERPDFLAKDGLELKDKFRGAHKDAEEAGKCLAFDRNTAGVFHLMHVVEVGLRELGRSLNNPELDPKRNPSWEALLNKCDDELKLPADRRTPEWRADPDFLSTATANLRAVKDAWRNPTLHIERPYDGEEAREVWNSVHGFMRHLCLKLG